MAYIPPNPNGQATKANSAPVTIASDQDTLPISVTALPLPSGAATSAKQPALGTAGSASSDVITVQGIASGTAQPISGTVTANASTNLNTSALALETGGNLAAIKTDVDKIPSQGQALAAASMPVVLPAAQLTSLTAPTVTQGTAAAITAGWPVIGGELADTTGTFTNATQTTSVATSSFDGYSTIIVSINGTYGTGTGVFEISDDGGTTWYSVNAARTDGSAVETGYTSLTNTNRMWTLSVSGADEFRVRSTALASGTANIRISVESMPTPEAASVSAYQTTAANFNATVVGTGTFATQSTMQTSTNSIGKISDITTSVVPGTAATNLGKAEDAGHTSGDTGVMALGVRNDTLADTTSTNADYAQLSTDIKGRVITTGAPRSLKGIVQVSVSNTTAETSILAATASTFHDVYGIILANTGASTTKVSIRDATAGTVRMIIEVPTLETRGFMLPVDSAVPQSAVNTAWTVQCGTATTALEVTLLYVSMV